MTNRLLALIAAAALTLLAVMPDNLDAEPGAPTEAHPCHEDEALIVTPTGLECIPIDLLRNNP